jgi:hypothetical protein
VLLLFVAGLCELVVVSVLSHSPPVSVSLPSAVILASDADPIYIKIYKPEPSITVVKACCRDYCELEYIAVSDPPCSRRQDHEDPQRKKQNHRI